MTNAITEPSTGNAMPPANSENVADILERQLVDVIHDWLARVEEQEDLMSIPLSYDARSGHLPELLHDVNARLLLDAGTKAPISAAASHHDDLRRLQGYSVAIVVEVPKIN
jgi:hypothetical protein